MDMGADTSKQRLGVRKSKETDTASYCPWTHLCDDADDDLEKCVGRKAQRASSAHCASVAMDASSRRIDDSFYDDAAGWIDVVSKTQYPATHSPAPMRCTELYEQNVGCILGDDMGLGKTVSGSPPCCASLGGAVSRRWWCVPRRCCSSGCASCG